MKNTCQAYFQHGMRWISSKIMMNIKKTLSGSILLYIWGLGEKSQQNKAQKPMESFYGWFVFQH